MPKISKESLRAMKAFTDKILAAGNINDGRVSEYFYNVWNNMDFPQNVRESAEYVYNIVKTSNYAAFENLTTASNTIQQMLDNPDYPDNDPDAETNSGIITDIRIMIRMRKQIPGLLRKYSIHFMRNTMNWIMQSISSIQVTIMWNSESADPSCAP